MPNKREVEAFLDRQKHVSHTKEDVYEILKVLSACESLSKGRKVAISGIISRSRSNLAELLLRSLGEEEVNIFFEGGYPDAERGRMIFSICPEISKEEARLKILELKFSMEVGHRDILGALISLGVKRSKLGDIGIDGSTAYAVVSDDMADFVLDNLERAGRSLVKYSGIVSGENFNMPGRRLEKKEVVASSMRADLVLSKLFGQSRKNVKGDIEKGKVKLNDFILSTANHCVSESDIVAYRGYGKAIIGKIKGTTKKGNYVVEVKKYV